MERISLGWWFFRFLRVCHHSDSFQALLINLAIKKCMSDIRPMKATQYAPRVSGDMVEDEICFRGYSSVCHLPHENFDFWRQLEIPYLLQELVISIRTFGFVRGFRWDRYGWIILIPRFNSAPPFFFEFPIAGIRIIVIAMGMHLMDSTS